MRSILERLESVPGNCTLGRELSASSITKIYLCVFNNIKSIIRFDLEAASCLAFDRVNEVSILQSINHLDLAPEILYSDAEAGILIWKYIEGTEPNFSQNKSNQNSLYDLGASLRSIHHFPTTKNSIDIFSNSMDLYQILLDRPSEKLLFKEAMTLYKELEEDGTQKVFSHNDLHQKNLLWNNKYYFLDWEYSGLNHPCFDIASLVKSFQLNQCQINELSLGYNANKNFFNMDVLNPWIKFIEYLEEIWEISLHKISNELKN
ncbi:phosphotransferase [Gammaproteobacteria bacterium]|nr:phosphotransferase [Gammaproteobacteria bacterium]